MQTRSEAEPDSLGTDNIQMLMTLMRSKSAIIRKFTFLIIGICSYFSRRYEEIFNVVASPSFNSMVGNGDEWHWGCSD